MTERRGNPLGWPWWLWHATLVMVVLMAAYSVTGSVTNFARAGGLLRDFPEYGVTSVPPIGRLGDRVTVVEVRPGGPADQAGLRPGDVLLSSPADRIASLEGAPLPIEIQRDGERFAAQIAPRMTFDFNGLGRPLLFLLGLGSLLTIALGTMLLTRSRGNRAAVLLGIFAFVLSTGFFASVPVLPLRLQVQQGLFIDSFGNIVTLLPASLWILFALEISGGASSRRQASLIHGAALAYFGWASLSLVGYLLGWLSAWGVNASVALQIVTSQLVGYAVIAWNYRDRDKAERNRLKIVLLGVVGFAVAGLVQVSSTLWLGAFTPAALTTYIVIRFLALALLAYAVVRQKVFDLNFALNRTLVYAGVSFVLLAAFGLAKWVIEHLIPASWHAGSEYYSVGIALVLFLILHRVHNSVERTVERFLFNPWHKNEEALRRFVAAAGHFDQTAVLCRAFAQELSRFANGGGAALYLRSRDGSYALECGKLADAHPEYAGDDLALALMRAERRPLRTGETQSALPGVLALPMLDHGRLVGFALLDRKPDGADYRPDEVEVLGWATHQVGLDLQAMHASELEAEVAGLNATVAGLRGVIAELSPASRARVRKEV